MPIIAGYSLEDYSRILTIARWIFGILALCAIVAGVFTQWISNEVINLQNEERISLREHLLASQQERQRTAEKTADVRHAIGQLTIPRQLGETQSAALRKSLQGGPRGKVVVTFLSVEWDAEQYARQIASLLIAAGFDVLVSEHLWVHLDHDGVFLVAPDSAELPPTSAAAHIQRCFLAAGVVLEPTVKSAEICETVGASGGTAVIVVSNRK